MKRTLPYFALGVAAVLTIVSGAVHGRLSNRWGTPADIPAVADLLTRVPAEFGPWQKESDTRLDARVEEMLECAGYVNRTYRHSTTQERVHVAILLGPPGPIAVHTPEICYSSQDYTITEKPHPVTIEPRGQAATPTAAGSAHTLWATTFRSNALDGAALRVYHGWSDGGPWSAPEQPRYTMAGSPYLYKIQLAGPSSADADTEDVGRQFLEDFLPVLQKHIKKSA